MIEISTREAVWPILGCLSSEGHSRRRNMKKKNNRKNKTINREFLNSTQQGSSDQARSAK